MKHLSLSNQLLLLSGVPLLALLAFAGVLAARTYEIWRNVEQTAALELVIDAVAEYSAAIPAEAILSLGAQDTGSAAMKARIPSARARADAAVAGLRLQAQLVGLTDPIALERLHGALTIDLAGNRARVDAGRQTLSDILATMRPATLDTIELVGRLAVLSTNARVSRLMLAYNVAMSTNDALLVERNVRPIAGLDGKLLPGLAAGEMTGVAQQTMLALQFERLADPMALRYWHEFLSDPSANEVVELRRTVLGLGGTLDASRVEKWSGAIQARLQKLAPVLIVSLSSLREAVSELQRSATAALLGYASLVLVSFGSVLYLVWTTRRHLADRVRRLCGTMQSLAAGDLETAIPAGSQFDEFGEMEMTLASFKSSLVERIRLSRAQADAAAALLNEKERLRVTLHAIGDGVIVTGSDRRVTMMNEAAENLTGWPLSAALAMPVESVLNLTQGTGRDCTLLRPDGAEVAIDASNARILGQDGQLIGSITVLHDVTESRRLLNRVRQLAHYDTLTGLPNRALLNDRLLQAVDCAKRNRSGCALLFLDMDRFKHVNDTLGHAVGDMLLREVGQRLSQIVREVDTVARLGGDEFVIILGDVRDPALAAEVASEILDAVSSIDRVDDHEINVSFSIGIALYPQDAQDGDELLMRADAAMYQAKDFGRNRCAFFDTDMDRAAQRRHQLRLQLAKALPLRQMFLLFQPKVDLRSGRLTGAEALLRWRPEPDGVISPLDFIPVAEESDLILQFDEWVVSETCRYLREWFDAGLSLVPVSVNVSMRSLRSESFLTTLATSLRDWAIPPNVLEVEITESAAMGDFAVTLALLNGIRALDVRVAIDDFGTGYSSLSRLRRLPVDTVKIDRSFVNNMVKSEDDAELVHSIIGIADVMRKHVIAEGVETEEQRGLLVKLGCMEGQGFLFSAPIAAAHFRKMLTTRAEPNLVSTLALKLSSPE